MASEKSPVPAKPDQLLSMLQRLLEMSATNGDEALQKTAQLVTQALGVEKVDACLAAEMARDMAVRKALEAKLQEQAALLQLASDAFLVQDEQNRLSFWSQGATRLYGWSEEEARGQVAFALLQTRFPLPLSEIHAILRQGGIWRGDLEHTTRDGRHIIVESSWQLIELQNGHKLRILEVNRDITERKRAEEQEHLLSQVSYLLSSTLDPQEMLDDLAQLVVPQLADWFTLDLVDTDGHLELLEVAHKYPERVPWIQMLRKQYFFNSEAVAGFPRVARTGQAELYSAVTDEMLVAATGNEDELALLRQIGCSSVMVVPLRAHGRTLGVLSLVVGEGGKRYDERDLALAEEVGRRVGVVLDNAHLYRQVQQSRDQLDVILQGVADGIIVYAPEDRIMYANEAAAQMSGCESVQELLALQQLGLLRRFELIDEQGQVFLPSQFTHQRVLEGEQKSQAIIGYREKGVEQPERWALVQSRPVFDERGKVTMVISIIHDLTERMTLERRKNEFISMASHELKTPITSLKGFTQILKRHLTRQGDERGLHYLARMDFQLNGLTSLIDDLLDISRIEAGKLVFRLETFDWDALIDETAENVQAATSTHRVAPL